jgi:deoxycytidine triphosphate deaminase
MLSRTEIKIRKLVNSAVPDSFQPSSYDLRIDCVIDSQGEIHYDKYILKPQEVAWVISKETVTLPDSVTATAHIKTGLCNDGILALNTGIVDPAWDGPLSTPLLNFGKTSHVLRSGDQFLRLVFYGHAAETAKPVIVTRPKYVADKQDKAVRFFGEKFLDANAILKEAFNNNIFKYAGVIGIASGLFVAIVGAVLTLGAIVINSNAFYGPSYYYSYFGKASEAASDQRDLKKRVEELELALKDLSSNQRK